MLLCWSCSVVLIFLANFTESVSDSTHLNEILSLSLARPHKNLPRWKLTGSATVSDDVIRLTRASARQSGSLWTRDPLVDMGPVWEVTIVFDIWGPQKHFFGDGFALWYTAKPGTNGPVFGAPDLWTGVGIFFDTFDNGQKGLHHPYISLQYNDGTRSYVHGEIPDESQQGISACQNAFRKNSYAPSKMKTMAKLRYDNRRMTLDIQADDSGLWIRCIDVKILPLPTAGWFFGMTAATGDLSDNHDIVRFRLATATADSVSIAETESDMLAENIGEKDDRVTDQEIEDIVASADIVKLLIEQGQNDEQKLVLLRKQLKSQADGLKSHVASMSAKLKQQEEDILDHVRHVESIAGIEIDEVALLHAKSATHWTWGFLVIFLLLCAASFFLARKIFTLRKKHIL